MTQTHHDAIGAKVESLEFLKAAERSNLSYPVLFQVQLLQIPLGTESIFWYCLDLIPVQDQLS